MPAFFFVAYPSHGGGPAPFIKKYDHGHHLQDLQTYFNLTESFSIPGGTLYCAPRGHRRDEITRVLVQGPEVVDEQGLQTIINLLRAWAAAPPDTPGMSTTVAEDRVRHWLEHITVATQGGKQQYAGPNHPFATVARNWGRPYSNKQLQDHMIQTS